MKQFTVQSPCTVVMLLTTMAGRGGSTATIFGSLDFLICLYHKRNLMSQAMNPGVEQSLTRFLNEWATKTNWGAQYQMVVAGAWGTWQNPPHTLVLFHTHHLVSKCFLISFVLFYLLSDAAADCGARGNHFVLFIYFSFSPPSIGKNSWKQQPGTFLIMKPFFFPLFGGEGSLLHGGKLLDNHVGHS